MSIAYIGLGSNIGDRVSYIQQATILLKDTEDINLIESSSLYETEPFGTEDQEWYVNAAVKIETVLGPELLLKECQRIEEQLGRLRDSNLPKWQPRTIDLDILFYDDVVYSTTDLQIPHSCVHLRAFALVPMLEIAYNHFHPVIGQTISDIHNSLPEPEVVYLYGTRPTF